MDFKIEICKEEFASLMDMLTEEKSVDIWRNDHEIFIEIHIKRIVKAISEIGSEISIKKKELDSLEFKGAKLMLLILNKPSCRSPITIELPVNDIIFNMFILEYYYNYKSPAISEDNYIISLDKELNTIIGAVEEVESVINEKVQLPYKVIDCGDTVTLELAKPFRLFLKSIRRGEEKTHLN